MSLFLLGFASTAFAPTQIAGLQLWLDATQITGLADGAAVATWSDVSGNGRNATQGTAGLRPLYKVNILNGKPGVLGDGVDDVMTISFSIPSATSIFLVYSSWVSGSIIGNNGAGTDMIQRATTNFPDSNLLVINTSQSMANNKILTMLFNYTTDNYTIRMDGASVGTSSAAADVPTAGAVTVLQSYNEPLAGYLHEVLVYNSVVSAANLATIEQYLASKWGVTLG